MEKSELFELLGRRWNLLKKLSEKEYFVSELADAMGMSVPPISVQLKELLEKGFLECEQGEGKKLKRYRLSPFTKRLFAVVNETPEAPLEKPLQEWQTRELLDILSDQELSEELRLSYSQVFFRLCGDSPDEMLADADVRRLLERIAANPTQDKVMESLARSFTYVLPYAMHTNIHETWVWKRIYPVLLRNMQSQNKQIRSWSIKKVGRIAALSKNPQTSRDVRNKLLEAWFSEDVVPDGDLGKELQQELLELASKELFQYVRKMARSESSAHRSKAEKLLGLLKESIFPRRRSNVPESARGSYTVT